MAGVNEDQETHQENLEVTSQLQLDEETGSNELKRSTKKALLEFRCRLEDAILGNYILEKINVNYSARESTKLREALRETSLWGVPLLPSKGHEGTDCILLKFLKARDFKVSEAFEMLRKTLIWRREFKVDGILEENLGRPYLDNVIYFNSTDKEGRPVCYNICGEFKDRNLYRNTFGSEEKCKEFLRWRVQFMEKGIKKFSFRNGGVNSIVQITDLKNSPGPDSREFRSMGKKALLLLQDNYPELIHRHIIINVPFWYYAYHVIHSRSFTQRTKSKFVLARPSRVAETLLKFISPENIPVQYGGLKRDDDDEFSATNTVKEITVKGGLIESIQVPFPESGVTVLWDLMVLGWEVTYKEEFVPDDECSYRILLQKEKKMAESVRNSFYINEPGKLVITITNGTFKKKRVFYRYKTKPTVPMYVFLK